MWIVMCQRRTRCKWFKMGGAFESEHDARVMAQALRECGNNAKVIQA